MYCKNCLGTINEGDKFCTSCGTPIEDKTTENIIEKEDLRNNNITEKEVLIEDNIKTENVAEKEALREHNIKAENQVENQADNSPRIKLDPKTGKSIMPEVLEKSGEVNKTEKAIKTRVAPIAENQKVYQNQAIHGKTQRSNKVVDKSGEFIIGIIAVALSYLTSLISAFFFVGIVAINIFDFESTLSTTSSDNLVRILMIIIGLKGFAFATVGLIGVMNAKKNSTVAGLFFMSAGVGSLFSLQLIRAGLFIGAAVLCFTRHEKTQKPIMNYIIGAFAPTIIILILTLVSFFVLGIAENNEISGEFDSVYVISQEMI